MFKIDSIWTAAGLVFLAAVSGTVSLALLSELIRDWARRRKVTRRLGPILAGRTERTAGEDVDLLRNREELEGLLAIMSRRVPGLRKLHLLMEQSGLRWSSWTFILLMAGSCLASGAAVLLLTRSLVFSAVAAVSGGFVPYMVARRRRAKRFQDFEEQFPEAIDLLTRAIRAGHPLASGMRMVAEEGPPEVAAEFRQAFEEQRFGLPFEEAMLGLVDRTDLVDVRIFAIAVLVQREVGGNLAEILENLAHTIRRRFFLRRQLRVYTAQGRMTGYALATLPVAVGAALYLIDPEYIGLLFSNPVGWFAVGGALSLQAVGALWIRKIIDIEM